MSNQAGGRWVILAPSAYRPSVLCIVGEGSSSANAWAEVIPPSVFDKANTFGKLKALLGRYEAKGYCERYVSLAEYEELSALENSGGDL